MAEKRGRPCLGEQVLDKKIVTYVSEKEYDILTGMSIDTGLSKGQIIRDALRLYYNMYKYRR